MKIALTLFRSIFLLFLLCSASSVYAGITIDSVHTTASTCANNGTITIHAHTTGGTLLYSITSGPVTASPQSSDLFSNLPSGVYHLLVTDAANDSARITDTIHGNYTSPNFTPTFKDPTCPGTATGIIVGNPQNAGTPPYTWVLTDITTNTTTTQASDSFFNLATGSYSLRETDSCQNYATYSITLSTLNDSFTISSITNRIFDCDSVSLYIVLNIIDNDYAQPYTIKVQTHNGSYQHTITDISYYAPNAKIYENVGGVTYGDSISVTITDACGRSVYKANTVSEFNISETFSSVTDSCHVKYTANFFVTAASGQTNVNTTYMPEPIEVIVYTSGGVFIDSTVTNDTVNHFSQYASSAALATGQSYKVTVIDGCGNSYTGVIPWPTAPSPSISSSIIIPTCMDSTAAIQLTWLNSFLSEPTIKLLSGPGHISSSKPHYVYYDTIIYPQSYICPGNPSNGYIIQLTNLAAGTYHYSISDSCGNTLTDSFTITKSNLNSDHFATSYIKGCPGNNILTLAIDNFCYANVQYGSTSINLTSPFDTVKNLSSGTYIIDFHYNQPTYAKPVNLNPQCQVIPDTVVIPPYQSPQMTAATQATCHGETYVVFLPDSATGVPPYKYQIITGPQTTGLQYSNIIPLTLAGTYTARLTDSCGFAGSYTFTLDTVTFGPVSSLGSSCVGNTDIISCLYSPYAVYKWHLPSGSSYTGDSLVIDPVTLASYGTYTISKIVNVDGCTDTFQTTFKLSGTGVSSITDSICAGQSYTFGGIARTQAGIYFDTVPASPCDSIVTLTLSIRSAIRDSVSQTICTGQSVTVGTNTYTTTGVYRDTFTTSGCDSIYILNLQVSGYKHGSVSQSICQGQSFTFGGLTLTQAGTYYDTLTTAGCDSIVTLTLILGVPGYDSVSTTICTGQSVTVGTHTYTTTGIYRDTFTTVGCDSVHVLNLQVGNYNVGFTSQTICQGQSYQFGTMTLTQAGLYYDTISTSGCDSIAILTLSVTTPGYDSVSQTICAGQSVTVGPNTYTTTGIYRDTFTTVGCDSIYVLNLQVGNYSVGPVSQSICQGQSFQFGTMTLTQSGIYYDTIPTSGCDSVTILTLTVTAPAYDSLSQSICAGQSVTIGTNTYTTTGIYRDTFATAGCDSVFVLNLQVNNYGQSSISESICQGQSFQFGTMTLTQAGVYYDTIPTSGCDSIVTLTLTTTTPINVSDTLSICQGQSVTVGANTYTQSGTYSDTLIATTGCDTFFTLQLTVTPLVIPSISITVSQGPVVSGLQIDTFTATYSDCTDPHFSWYQDIVPLGIHTAIAIIPIPIGTQDSISCRIDCENGCQSSEIHVFSNSIYYTGINQISSIEGVSIYPNPAQGSFNMDINAASITNKEAQISVMNMVGQSILSRSVVLHTGPNKELFSMSDAVSGVYIIQLTVDGQSQYYRLVLDKQN